MIHLIWSTINVIIALYFFYLIIGYLIKGNRIFKPQFRALSIFILVIGMVNMIFADDNVSNRILINDNYNENVAADVKAIKLEDNLTFDIDMLVVYADVKSEYIPVESHSYLTGFVSGYTWKFKSIDMSNLNQDGKLHFTAKGKFEWNIFGLTIFSELKTFTGTIE